VAAGQAIRNKIHWILVAWIILTATLDVVASADNLPGGIKFYAMTSNSMHSVIPANSLVINKARPFYRINEIITFKFPGSEETVTHRIVNTNIKNNITYYITKGDDNKLIDRHLIPFKNIHGKVIGTIPLLGWLVKFIGSELGLILLIVVPAILVVRKEIIIIKNEFHKVKK